MDNPFKDIVVRLEGIENSIGLLRKTVLAKDDIKEHYTRHEAAEKLRVSIATVDRMLKNEVFTKVKVGSKSLIPIHQINTYLGKEPATG